MIVAHRGTSPLEAPSADHRAPSNSTVSPADAFAFAARQLRRLVTAHPDRSATYTEDGRWIVDQDGWAPTWTGGFLAGQLWLVAQHTGDPWFRDQALRYTRALEPRASDHGTHDIGFLMEPSFGRWFDATGDPHAREVLVTAGRTMAARLQPAGGYLSTWVDPGSTFIDVMMNVGIIFRAAELSGDDALAAAALRHCLTSRRYLVRGDGSTIHEGWFDPETGEFLRAATHQGWRPDSCWARGQAWAIYGFADAYTHAGTPELLATARAAADYFLAHTMSDPVPPNDFDDPSPVRPYESSAACIAAAGLARLADCLTAEPTSATRYRTAARRILETLCTPAFLAIASPGWEGMIRHGTYHARNGLGVDESVMWGDYYFLEALLALCASEVPRALPTLTSDAGSAVIQGSGA